MTIEVSYPHIAGSRVPSRITAQNVWSLAERLRGQLTSRSHLPRLDLDRLVRQPVRMKVNGTHMTIHWDLGRKVHDARGREALGVTEADPALPNVVLVNLNPELIADRDYLKRSTIAHEFGHAIFDGPSMLAQAMKPVFAMVTTDEAHLETAKRGRSGMDWREFRANEFMGALLVPRALLQRELSRRAAAFGLGLRDVGGGLPGVRKVADPHRIEALLVDLAERFGVSTTFIEYRLHRYKLIQ